MAKNIKVTKNKLSYSNKGTVPSKTKAGTFSASTTSTPGTGKGKARGMGAAEFGGKFSGIY
tara:strand:+ start:908 stop:1090 length:183 start_codon:yes stop_codon:yes gene_type:complete